jgi:hypothetical protein
MSGVRVSDYEIGRLKYIHLYNYTMLCNAYTVCVCVMYTQVEKAPFPAQQNQHFKYIMHSVTLHTQF